MTVAIGNGSNDQLILKEAALGIAVLGDDGVSVSTINNSDLLEKNIHNALDLFLETQETNRHFERLKGTFLSH